MKLQIITAFHLKMIAIITMIIDHFGLIFFPQEEIYRIIGRIAFMLFAFLLVEGVEHTKDFKGYLKRLLIWALISEIPFDLAMTGELFNLEKQNVFFTLFLSAFGIYQVKNSKTRIKKIAVIIATFFVIDLLKADYGTYGLMVIYAFYLMKKMEFKLIFIQILSSFATFFVNYLQMWSGLAFLPIVFYNGKQGIKTGKIFYSFYAVHLLLFSVIKIFIIK
ncbi:TraX family protein [Riemerella anatipestifer]|uniref:TraX family protein n=1 Tax=Riemerella anatipestifer TaxID=34085 RepID=A0AAP6HE72_RIEAN|nr:TraX family protein [Riemerella anatipestifer]MCO7354049.1 conjugal transfer protein TraX [Riemerella anatipestifer]MCU7571149.1 conjugal transfer protein TraX [Riemerella anatipestifer]MCU7597574.1 conjugal transfer protein TraX [Riemerella anatipestifer]MCW0494221.1 conjugal transfer protein TraX [Riemerella anatipestifer]MCW0502266.1 conjugal transfer protein TraX [Riemerella anatipestifer]